MIPSQQFIVGKFALGMGCIGLGAVTLAYRDFALQWQPVPATLPGFTIAVYVSAAALIAGGIGIQIPRVAKRAALGLCLYFAVFWVLPHLLRLAPQLTSLAAWLGACEVLGEISGVVVLFAMLAHPNRGAAPRWLAIPQRLFGICCVVFGLSHFVYAGFTAQMIPTWIPARMALAYITGAGHLLAGMALLTGIWAPLAARLEALMMSLFVLLLHLPSLWASPLPAWAINWRSVVTPFFWATCLAACAWLVAASLDRVAPTAPAHP